MSHKQAIKHPMIQAVGEDEFCKVLKELPEEYTLEFEGNYKSVAMQLIWDLRYLDPVNWGEDYVSKIKKIVDYAMSYWRMGVNSEKAVKMALKKVKNETL